MISALRDGTTTSQKFWGRDSSGGVLGVYVDGSLTTGDTLVSGNDYTGIVEVTGLSEGSHTYQMALDGVAVGDEMTFTTLPDNGDSFDMLFMGDPVDGQQIFGLIVDREPQARALFCHEFTYIEGGFYGTEPACDGTQATGTDGACTASYLAWYRGGYADVWSETNVQRILNHCQSYFMWNNHEFDSNDPTPESGQIQHDTADQAFSEYEGKGQPSASDDVYTVDSYPDPVVYFSKIIGDVLIIATDCSSYSEGALDYQLDGDGYATARGEGMQTEWVKSVIDNAPSTVKNIIMFHPTPVTGGTAAARGEWYGASGIIPVNIEGSDKNVMFAVGNTHVPMISGSYRSAYTSTPILMINCSPIRQTSKSNGNAPNAEDDTVGQFIDYGFQGAIGNTNFDDVYSDPNQEWVYLLVQRRPSGGEHSSLPHTVYHLKYAVTGKTMGICYQIDGDKTTYFPERKRAVI